MKNFILLIFTVCLFSCDRKTQTFNFDQYDLKHRLMENNAATQHYQFLDSDKYELTITAKNYKKQLTVLEKEDKIYWYCNKEFVLSHSLSSKDRMGSCYDIPPFLNRQISLIGYKTYILSGKKYTIYSFDEINGGDSEIATYYLKETGFICYFDLKGKSYYFLSGTSEFKGITSDVIEKIRKKLVNDSTFFAVEMIKRTPPIKFQ